MILLDRSAMTLLGKLGRLNEGEKAAQTRRNDDFHARPAGGTARESRRRDVALPRLTAWMARIVIDETGSLASSVRRGIAASLRQSQCPAQGSIVDDIR